MIPVNSTILKWAREKQGLGIDEVAHIFRKEPSEIEAWETGEKAPTYVQLEKLAYQVYKRPIAIFFFPAPPTEEPLERSFRTLPETEIAKISPKLRTLIRKAKATQLALGELLGASGQENITNTFNFTYKTPLQDIIDSVREYLGISIEEQTSWSDSNQAFKNWRLSIENKGIYIFKDAFYDNNFSGFCLHDDSFPLIYVNNSQSDNRQIFSLFHELAHLLLGVSGIETNSEEYMNFIHGDSKSVEVFCNKFAGEFLVPEKNFDNDISNITEVTERRIQLLATKYKVSREVILRKFYDRHIINQYQYEQFVSNWKAVAKNNTNGEKKSSGGNYYLTQGVYISEAYAGIVFQKYYKNLISLPDVANYLGVKAKSVEGIENSFLNKQLS